MNINNKTTNKAELLMRHYRYLLSSLFLIVTSACAAPAPTDGFYTINDPSATDDCLVTEPF